MKVLVYGFGPYDAFEANLTEEIVRKLPKRNGLRTHVFEVRFSKSMFLSALTKTKPDLIIGMGQHPRARKLRIERKAVNLWAQRGKEHKVIHKKGPQYLFSNLSLPQTGFTTVTYDAGTFLCNFSLYVCTQYAQEHDARSAFLHVPLNFSIPTMHSYLWQAIKTAD